MSSTDRGRKLVAAEILLGTALAVLAWLVVSGACAGIDQYAIDHWMVGISSSTSPQSFSEAFRPYPNGGTVSQTFFNVWTFGGSVFVSGVALALCCFALVRRGQRSAAGLWVAAWVVANGAEVVGKGLLLRPALSSTVHGVRLQLRGFDASFPSGHTARALLVAFMLAAVWPRVTWLVGLWAASACVVLVVSAAHTPSDVAGGLLVALLVRAGVEQGLAARARPALQE